MDAAFLDSLFCPKCQGDLRWHSHLPPSDKRVLAGVLSCAACSSWYPVENGFFELSPNETLYREDRERFWQRHKDKLLSLGLSENQPNGIPEAENAQAAEAKTISALDAKGQGIPLGRLLDASVFGQWRRQLRPRSWLLYLGVGQSANSFHFLASPVRMVVFDPCKRGLERVVTQFRKGKPIAGIVPVSGDCSCLPFADETFDFVISYGVFPSVIDPAGVCQEIARVLKPRGKYFGAENNRTTLHELWEKMPRSFGGGYAGPVMEPAVSTSSLRECFAETSLAVKMTTHAFVPLSVVRRVGISWGRLLVRLSDRVGQVMPVVSHHGAMILLTGEKQDAVEPVAPANPLSTG